MCSGSIGDRVKVLFMVEDEAEEEKEMSFEELCKYFHSIFTICFDSQNDVGFDIDIEKLARATCQNLFDSTMLKDKK